MLTRLKLGGHGSRPQFSKDSIVAMGEAILALQTIVSRNVSPYYAAVVSICCAQSGDPDGTSVMPQKALLRGTTRSYEPEVQDLIERRMNEIAQGIAQTYGIKATVNYTRLYPAMYNTPENVQAARVPLGLPMLKNSLARRAARIFPSCFWSGRGAYSVLG